MVVPKCAPIKTNHWSSKSILPGRMDNDGLWRVIGSFVQKVLRAILDIDQCKAYGSWWFVNGYLIHCLGGLMNGYIAHRLWGLINGLLKINPVPILDLINGYIMTIFSAIATNHEPLLPMFNHCSPCLSNYPPSCWTIIRLNIMIHVQPLLAILQPWLTPINQDDSSLMLNNPETYP